MKNYVSALTIDMSGVKNYISGVKNYISALKNYISGVKKKTEMKNDISG